MPLLDPEQTPAHDEASSSDSEWRSRSRQSGQAKSASILPEGESEVQLRAKSSQQALLVEVNALLAQAVNAEEVLGPIAARLQERGGLLGASIYLIDAEKRSLRCVIEDGSPPSEAGQLLSVDAPDLVSKVARTGEAAYLPVVGQDPRDHPRHANAKSVYIVPLIGGVGVVGVLEIKSRHADGIRATFRKMVDQLAAPVALALERSAFYRRLLASERLFRSMFEQGDFGAALCSLEGTFSSVNPAFARLLGLEPEALRGARYLDTVHPEDQAGLQEQLEQVLAGKAPCLSTELRLCRQSGEPVWCLATVSMIRDSGGSPLYALAVVHDVSARKRGEEERAQLQEQLFHAQKMDAVGRLANGMAHEFNNLLGVIMGFTSLARARMQPGDSLLEPLSTIEQTAALAGELTRKLLGFARREKTQLRPVRADAILSRIATVVTQTFDRRIRVETRLGSAPAWVNGDESLLEQALLNLCINARDAMPQGGTLHLESSREKLEPQDLTRPTHCPAGDYVRIVVRDSGTGIDPQLLPRIFEPFITTKQPVDGTGLGLATVYATVKNHGGFIRVSNELGQGAEFVIHLPAAPPPEERAIKRRLESLERGSGTILVVDDEPLMRASVEQGLKALGYQVWTAEDGRQAHEIFAARGQEVDCILLDMVMPGLSWMDICRRLREINPQVKVILSSGHSDPRKTHQSLALGPLEFIGKPYSLETLARLIAKVLTSEKQEGRDACES